MLPNNEEFHTSAMVEAVRDMARKLEHFERHADDERKKLRAGVDSTVAAMREDFWKTTLVIQRDQAQHRDEHTAERQERTNRQASHDIWMGALTVLGLINLALALYLVFQVAR